MTFVIKNNKNLLLSKKKDNKPTKILTKKVIRKNMFQFHMELREIVVMTKIDNFDGVSDNGVFLGK